jgi:ABC-type uncharacterized transport system substrate-binding protein
VLYTLRRLALGLFLIALASAILLIADRGHRVETARHVSKVAIFQHASTPVLDDGIRGTIEALAERGFREGDRITIERFNAQGDMPTGIAIAKQLTSGDYDLVITASTPSMQAVANANRAGKVRHIFTVVADPFAAGIGLDRANPLTHPPYMAGQSTFPPVEKAFQLARRMLPGLKRIGVPWNPAESNSLSIVTQARDVAAKMGLTLLEANVDNSSAVSDAVNSLIVRDAQAIWVGGDNTVIAAVDSVIATCARTHVPVFTVLPGAPDRGTIFDVGPNFYEVGRQGGLMAADVLDGADMARIPVRDIMDVLPAFLSVNTKVLKGLRESWHVPDDVLATADVVVDETGVHKKAIDAPAAVNPATDRRPLTKKWRLDLIELNQTLDVEDSEKGVLDGLGDLGLVEGRDFERTVRNAQGDMATVTALVDAAVTDGSDLIIAFSTPTLQAAVQRVKRIPVVFTYVADPIAAGAGTSNTQHPPNLTGVYLLGAYDRMPPVLRAYLPHVHTLGTVYVPAEVNMVSQLAVMSKAIHAAGMELKSVAANSPTEVGEATLSLVSSHVDAICQLPGNLTAAAFPSIAQVSKQARVPVFVFQTSQVHAGAVFALARDYYESGRETAALVARVMRGESPAQMPFVCFAKTKVIVNVAAAQAIGLKTPPAILAKADDVIRK